MTLVGGLTQLGKCGRCGSRFETTPQEIRSASRQRRKLTCRNCTPAAEPFRPSWWPAESVVEEDAGSRLFWRATQVPIDQWVREALSDPGARAITQQWLEDAIGERYGA